MPLTWRFDIKEREVGGGGDKASSIGGLRLRDWGQRWRTCMGPEIEGLRWRA